MGIRPNKTNFGLPFGHFGSKREEEKRKRREEEEEEEKKGMELGFCMETTFLYGFMALSMETLSMEVFVWILVVQFLGFS